MTTKARRTRMVAQARPKRGKLITVMEAPDNIVEHSCFGTEIPFRILCEGETNRLRRKGAKAFIFEDNKTGGIAVAVG